MSLVFPERIDRSGKIEYPSYKVYFNVRQNNKKTTTLEKVQACAQRSLQLISIFFVSFRDSLFKNLGSSGTSFKYIVLGYYGSWTQISFPEDAHLVVFKIVFWVACMGWGTIATTFRLFFERTSSNDSSPLLELFASNEINVDHIKTEEFSLDASNVPEDIQVNTLRELFYEINFSDPTDPRYMAGRASQKRLESQLNTFIHRVNTREAFVGTPPSYDMPRLMDFYQQIIDAVRLSIYKVVKDIEEFENQNGTNFHSFNSEQKRTYRNLLEIRARLVLDLAGAGGYCAARYMGEAMDTYYSIYNKKGIPNAKDLQGTLIEILAKKREEIAKNEALKQVDTHNFTNYMSNMGKILGIPGTKNVIEHLSRNIIDIHKVLADFFKEYTVDTIINTIQEKIKTSQNFREKITDWIKGQINDWNREKYKNLDEILKKIEDIKNNHVTETTVAFHFQMLQTLLRDLKKDRVTLPGLKQGWDNFLTELFALCEVKKKIKSIIAPKEESKEATMRALQLANSIKASCSEAELGSELLQELQETIASADFIPIFRERYLPKFIDKEKIKKIKKVLPLAEDDSLLRLLKKEKTQTDLIAFIQSHQEQVRKRDFFDFLQLENIFEKIASAPAEDLTGTKNLTDAENKAYQRLIEWILVSQKILKPQIKFNQSKAVHMDLTENQASSYLETMNKVFSENAESFSHILNTLSIRYREGTSFKRDAFLTWIFNQSAQQKKADEIVTAAEEANERVFYPKWKKVCLIQLPKSSANILDNPYFKVASSVSIIVVSFCSMSRVAVKTSRIFAANRVFIIINNAIMVSRDLIFAGCLIGIIAIYLVKKALEILPEIPYLSASARSINLDKLRDFLLYSNQTFVSFISEISTLVTDIVQDIFEGIAQQFHSISDNAKKERQRICRQKCLEVWETCLKSLSLGDIMDFSNTT